MKKLRVVLFMVVLLAANLVNLSEIFTNYGSKVTPISPRSSEDGLTFNIFGTTPAIADTGDGGGGGGGGCWYNNEYCHSPWIGRDYCASNYASRCDRCLCGYN